MKKGNYKTARSGVVHRLSEHKKYFKDNVYCCGLLPYVDSHYLKDGNSDKFTRKPVTCKNCLKAKS